MIIIDDVCLQSPDSQATCIKSQKMDVMTQENYCLYVLYVELLGNISQTIMKSKIPEYIFAYKYNEFNRNLQNCAEE